MVVALKCFRKLFLGSRNSLVREDEYGDINPRFAVEVSIRNKVSFGLSAGTKLDKLSGILLSQRSGEA